MLMLASCLQTNGRILATGNDIPEQIHEVRSYMGCCPQHNILWNELAVWEHVQIIGRIGDMNSAEIQQSEDVLLFQCRFSQDG